MAKLLFLDNTKVKGKVPVTSRSSRLPHNWQNMQYLRSHIMFIPILAQQGWITSGYGSRKQGCVVLAFGVSYQNWQLVVAEKMLTSQSGWWVRDPVWLHLSAVEIIVKAVWYHLIITVVSPARPSSPCSVTRRHSRNHTVGLAIVLAVHK